MRLKQKCCVSRVPSFYLERGNTDHLASGTQKSSVREIQHLLIADIIGDENEDICGRLRGDPLLHATSTTDPRCFARAASRMGRAQWRLPHLRVVRIAPRRTASSFFAERTSLGCIINPETIPGLTC